MELPRGKCMCSKQSTIQQKKMEYLGGRGTGRAWGSPFWNDLQSVKPAFAMGANFSIGNGRSTRFWTDRWLGAQPLWIEFRDLYELAFDPSITVAAALAASPPVIYFKRELNGLEQSNLLALMHLINPITLADEPDTVSWALTSSGKFMVNSLYRRLCRGMAQQALAGLWKAQLPLKIKLFMWQLFRDKLPTSLNVAKRNGPAIGPCALCGEPEDASHAFFRCPLARFAWSAVWSAAGVQWDPRSAAELTHLLDTIHGSAKRVMWRCVGALLWSIWLTRNKFTIEGCFRSHPANILFKCNLLLQQWSPLGRRRDTELINTAQQRLLQVYVMAREP